MFVKIQPKTKSAPVIARPHLATSGPKKLQIDDPRVAYRIERWFTEVGKKL